MTQAFLNEATLELARERYLTRWHLESVSKTWNGRKPSQAQFNKRFKDAFDARQRHLTRTAGGTLVVEHSADQRVEAAQELGERLLSLLSGNATTDGPEAEILGSADVDEQASGILAILNRQKAPTKVEAVVEPEQKFVKPENFDELPRSGQVYFFLHRAQEAGYGYAIVPLKRGVAAEAISQIKDDGRTYQSVASALLKAK